MCVGQPLKTLTDTKVSFLSPDKHRARGPWGKALVGNQMASKKKACRLPLPPQSVDWSSIPLPSFRVGGSQGRVICPFSSYLHAGWSNSNLERWDLHGCEERVLPSQEKWFQSGRRFCYHNVPLLRINPCCLRNKATLTPCVLSLAGSLSSSSHLQWEGTRNLELGKRKCHPWKWRILHRNQFLFKMDHEHHWKLLRCLWSSIPSVQDLHDFHPGSTTLLIMFLVLEQNSLKRNDTKNLHYDTKNLFLYHINCKHDEKSSNIPSHLFIQKLSKCLLFGRCCICLGLSGGLVAKNPPAMQETQEMRVQSLSREDPLEEEMATHSRILAEIILWAEELGGLQSMGS